MKSIFIISLFAISLNSFSAIVCHTPRMNKNFEIKNNKISFYKNELNLNDKREIASVNSRNKNDPKGITKIVDFENQKHTIHIEDTNSFSDVNDYIIIRNKIGHEVTYPLTCNNK